MYLPVLRGIKFSCKMLYFELLVVGCYDDDDDGVASVAPTCMK